MDCSSSSKITHQVSQLQKDQDEPPSQGTQGAQRKLQPEWLEKFLQKTFFDPCSKHHIHRNDLNKYCIDCDELLCHHCLSLAVHSHHMILNVCRHVYMDAVPLVQIVQHIDCTKIQPYKCNRRMVIDVNRLPCKRSGKTSEAATCITCKKKLVEHGIYKYCSITCKVEAFKKKRSDSAPPFLLLDQKEQNAEVESSSKRTRKRKGIPHRAPFF